MMIGGYTGDYISDVEVVDLNSADTDCLKPRDITVAVSDAVATYIDETVSDNWIKYLQSKWVFFLMRKSLKYS
jgi:hypothetical protein